MYEDIKGLDFGNIYGAGTGSQDDLSKLINSLYGTLAQGGYFGTDYMSSGTKYGESLYSGINQQSFGTGEEGGYNIDDIISKLEGYTGNLGDDTDKSKPKQGYEILTQLLKNFRDKDIAGDYRQDVGTIGSEFGSQMQTLQKGYGSIGKAGRYGKVGTGGRQIGQGTRQQYMSDYYSLMDKNRQMQQDLQDKLQEQFSTNVGQELALYSK